MVLTAPLEVRVTAKMHRISVCLRWWIASLLVLFYLIAAEFSLWTEY